MSDWPFFHLFTMGSDCASQEFVSACCFWPYRSHCSSAQPAFLPC